MSKRLVRNTLALSSAQVARIGFNTTLSLLIARLLGAEGLGKYAILTAYLQIFQVLIAMGVPKLAIREMARRPYDEEGKRHWFQVMLVNQVLGAGGGVLVLLVLTHILNYPSTTVRALKVVSLSLFPFAVSSAVEALLQAEEKMELIALAQIVSRGIQVIGSVVMLLAGEGIVALAGMLVAGHVVTALVEVLAIKSPGIWYHFRVDIVKTVYLSYISSAFFAQSVMAIVFSKISTLILAQMAGEEAAGLYSAAYLIIHVVNFLSVSYSRAVYPVLARLFGESVDRFREMLRRSVLFGLLVTLIVAIQINIVADPIVRLLYGESYVASIPVLQIESPFVVIFLWNALLSNGLLVSNLQQRSVIVSSVKLGMSLICYPLLTAWLGSVGTALGTLAAGIMGAALNYYFLSKEVCSLDLLNLLVKPVFVGLLTFGGLRLAKGAGVPWPGLMAGGGGLYLALLSILRVITKDDVHRIRRIAFP